MTVMHASTKLLFPEVRERRFVDRHRGAGHKVIHHGTPQLGARCYWRCSCGARYWC